MHFRYPAQRTFRGDSMALFAPVQVANCVEELTKKKKDRNMRVHFRGPWDSLPFTETLQGLWYHAVGLEESVTMLLGRCVYKLIKERPVRLEKATTLTPSYSLVTKDKAAPFGAHFAVRIESVSNKLVCALAASVVTCADDPDAC